MDDVKKQLFANFASERLSSISATNKVLCIIDDVYSELIGVPTDVPFNVLNENITQDETEYTIDISILGLDNTTSSVPESKSEIYYSTKDISHSVEDFFDPYVDIQDVEDIYSLYGELDQVEDEDEEADGLIDTFFQDTFQDEEDYEFDDEDYEDSEEVNEFLKNL